MKMGLRKGAGVKISRENALPNEPRVSHKRPLNDENENTAKKPRNAAVLKVQSENIAINQIIHESKKAILKETCSNATKTKNDYKPPPKKNIVHRPKKTNVMVQPTEANARDFYVKKTNLPDGVVDIDLKMIDDHSCEAHNSHESFLYLRRREELFIGTPYMQKQPEVPASYRALLVDWMVEIQESFELNHETLYLSVKIVDRFLGRAEVSRKQLQLLGASALLIASKIDERVPPSLDEFKYICDDAYTRDEFMVMERRVLEVLEFDISIPLSYTFLRRYCRSIDMNLREMTLARFILECSLLDYSLITEKESKLAAASLLLAMDILDMQWNETLTYYTGYKPEELKSLRNDLNKLVHHLRKQFNDAKDDRTGNKTVFVKYSHDVFHKVATYEFPPCEE